MGYNYDEYDNYLYTKPPFVRYGPFEIMSFIMSCAIGIAIIFSLSCAIGYLADLAEEFPTRAKKILHTIAIAVLLVHSLILIVDQLSLWRSLISIITNILHLRLLAGFPHISLTHPLTISVAIAVLVETFAWYTLFVFSYEFHAMIGITRLIAFITFLWIMPIGLVVSLEVDPVGLPGSGFGSSTRHNDIASSGGRKKTVFKAIKSWFTVPTD